MTKSAESVLPDPEVEPTVSVTRAGELLGYGRDAAYEAIRKGTFPVKEIRIGRQKMRIPTRPLLDVLGRH